jgi:hypothetical protein
MCSRQFYGPLNYFISSDKPVEYKVMRGVSKRDSADSGQLMLRNAQWTMFSCIFARHIPVVIYRTEEKIE